MPPLPTVLRDRLLTARNPDGGWPYYRGKTSRLEPTAWALLALQAAGEAVTAEALTSWPRREGWLVDRSSDAVNVAFNAMAGIALRQVDRSGSLVEALESLLLETRGRQLPQFPIIEQNNALQAWPWLDRTFSWAEPTALAMVFLKRTPAARRDARRAQRLNEAERLLLDRVCRQGGWNYGNANIFGASLEPYVPTSALCLLAMADKAHLEPVERSRAFLVEHRVAERSGMALSLTRVALGVFDQPAGDVDDALVEAAAHTSFLDNLHLSAMALYALAGSRDGYEAFRV